MDHLSHHARTPDVKWRQESLPTTHWNSTQTKSAFCARWANNGQTWVSRCETPTRQRSHRKISTDLLPTTYQPTRLVYHAAQAQRSATHWYQQQLLNNSPARLINSHPPARLPAFPQLTLRQRHTQHYRASSYASD